jgi:hypothetical protein
MTTPEVASIITSLAALLAAIGSIAGVLVSLRNGRKVDATVVKVEEIHKATNGLVKELSSAKLAQGDAEGHARGLEEGRAKDVDTAG